jgi:predicted RNase H-like HicB family nuclease
MARPLIVTADWDPEAAVWVATSRDLRGLVAEAESIERLRTKLPGMVLDLIEEGAIFDRPPSIKIVSRPAEYSAALP